jgi:hypothetical protein
VKYFANNDFWKCYYRLPKKVQQLADNNFKLLKENSKHPSLHLKEINDIWSVRVGIKYRALGVEKDSDIVWFWIGSHSDYDKIIK